MKHINFKRLLLNNKPSVLALVNEKDKKVLIQYSNNPMKALGALVADLSNNTHNNKELRKDKKRLRFKLLEQTFHPSYKLKYIDLYKAQGYTLYNTEKLPQYEYRITILEDMTVEVRLVSKGKRVKSIKKFDTIEGAKMFVSNIPIWEALCV